MMSVRYHTADIDGFKVFYRKAGPSDAPNLLLLHGFPSAGHMFRNLIPLLAERFLMVAPDLPGFGQSDMPPHDKFSYTFDNIARVIERFTEVIGFDRFAVYVFDYGAPTGFRLAVRHPERIAIGPDTAERSGASRASIRGPLPARETACPTRRVSALVPTRASFSRRVKS